jgi:hypothetical protein
MEIETTLKPGSNIDSWCGPCKLILAHTIEAMVGQKPVRVHCNTCKAQHTYKPYKPGESQRKVREREPDGTLRPLPAKPRASQYQKLLKGKDMALAKPYSTKDNYTAGDVLDHPSFGVGVTTAIKDGTKIEVVFEAGIKVLVHGR